MKSLSLGLIKGFIDQVEGCIHVTWVIPKYLDKNEINIFFNLLLIYTNKLR